MKTLWRHENAGIIGFVVRNVIIVNNSKTKVVPFCLHTQYHSRESLHTRYRKILISWGQQNYIGKIICVCNNMFYSPTGGGAAPFSVIMDKVQCLIPLSRTTDLRVWAVGCSRGTNDSTREHRDSGALNRPPLSYLILSYHCYKWCKI